jgi:hypothetical protein
MATPPALHPAGRLPARRPRDRDRRGGEADLVAGEPLIYYRRLLNWRLRTADLARHRGP